VAGEEAEHGRGEVDLGLLLLRAHRAGTPELDHHCAAVVPDDAQVPQEQQQVGAVAVAEKGLGVGAK